MPESAFDMAACLERVRQGDEEAASALAERLYPFVLKLVRAHLPRRTSEDDLVQTVFMKVFTKLDQFSGRVPLEHWVSRIAVNTCLNELKAEKARPEWRWSDLSEEEQHVLNGLMVDRQSRSIPSSVAARDLLDRLLNGLGPQDRLVIQLLHLEERSVAEVKRLTGWSIPAVKVRAFRARQRLQAQLDSLMRKERR